MFTGHLSQRAYNHSKTKLSRCSSKIIYKSRCLNATVSIFNEGAIVVRMAVEDFMVKGDLTQTLGDGKNLNR